MGFGHTAPSVDIMLMNILTSETPVNHVQVKKKKKNHEQINPQPKRESWTNPS